MDTLATLGTIAGIGGISLGVFSLIVLALVRSGIFPRLGEGSAYRLLLLLIIACWTIGAGGVIAYVLQNGKGHQAAEQTTPANETADDSRVKEAAPGTVTPESPPTTLTVKNVSWEHLYQPNGDYCGVIEYQALNETSINHVDLPSDKAGWFGWNIAYDAQFTILDDKAGLYNLDQSVLDTNQRWDRVVDGSECKMTYFIWTPRLHPALGPGEDIKYKVRFCTERTEVALFTDTGSFAGMGAPFVTDKISCVIRAPEGYRLEILGKIIRDRSAEALVLDRFEQPELNDDRTMITWEVDDPVPSALYLVRIRGVK
jgi:hypothetical protein